MSVQRILLMQIDEAIRDQAADHHAAALPEALSGPDPERS
jgi:hypothetical protein